jgi:hypothetical protein
MNGYHVKKLEKLEDVISEKKTHPQICKDIALLTNP